MTVFYRQDLELLPKGESCIYNIPANLKENEAIRVHSRYITLLVMLFIILVR